MACDQCGQGNQGMNAGMLLAILAYQALGDASKALEAWEAATVNDVADGTTDIVAQYNQFLLDSKKMADPVKSAFDTLAMTSLLSMLGGDSGNEMVMALILSKAFDK